MVTSTFNLIRPIQYIFRSFQSQTRRSGLLLIILSVLISILGVAQPQISTPALVSKTAPTTDIPSAVVSAPGGTTFAVSPGPDEITSIDVAIPKNCIPPTYNLPSKIDLTNQASGLSQIIDTPKYYQVYGNTSAQIKRQLQQCAPIINGEVSNFGAYTGSNLVWQYSLIQNDGETCSVSNVKVGLHTNMLLPKWGATSSTSNGLASSWQYLINNLTTHENGHVAINQKHAQKLLSDMESVPASDCQSIVTSINAKTAANITALNQANDAYDDQTNHGVDQGAVLR